MLLGYLGRVESRVLRKMKRFVKCQRARARPTFNAVLSCHCVASQDPVLDGLVRNLNVVYVDRVALRTHRLLVDTLSWSTRFQRDVVDIPARNLHHDSNRFILGQHQRVRRRFEDGHLDPRHTVNIRTWQNGASDQASNGRVGHRKYADRHGHEQCSRYQPTTQQSPWQ